MLKILLWGRMTPYANDTVADILLKNKIASNPGNLLFTYSVARSVMTEDIQLDPFFSEDVDRLLRNVQELNETYDCAVIPLANAFRADYMPKMKNLTRFIRSVKIPCYVIGVGIQASSMDAIHHGFAFDETARDFVSAVLEKSSMLGLRGEITAQYLKHLGFAPERHFTVIGCPAAYITGSQCANIHPKPFEQLKHVSVNAKPGIPEQVHEWIARSYPQFEQANFVTQDLYELWNIYFGLKCKYSSKPELKYYPFANQQGETNWKNGRVMGFLRATDWMEYMRGMDLSFGSRIHGNMIAMISGTPALVAVSDMRVQELAQYHGIPYIFSKDINEQTSLRDLYENADFNTFARRYLSNFNHYVDFLNENGIRHIYRENDPGLGNAPCDLAITRARQLPEIYKGMPIPLVDRLRKPEMYKMMIKFKIDRFKLKKELKKS